MVQSFEYGFKPLIDRIGRLGLGGATTGPEDPAALGGSEVVPGVSKVCRTGFPIFSVSLTRTSRSVMTTMLVVRDGCVQNSCNTHDVQLKDNLPSGLNLVDRKTLSANDASLPHLPVFQQRVELIDCRKCTPSEIRTRHRI